MRITQRMRFTPVLCVLWALAPVVFAQNKQVPPSGGSRSAVLLELFTSEGCSSCPPADALLRQLDGTTSSSGQLLVALSEHVTYWNRLGWSDPFSSETFTDRQNGYAARFHLDSVYTPQLVVNGDAQAVGSQGGEVKRAIAAQERSMPRLDLRILSSVASGDHLILNYSVLSDPPKGGVDLYAAIADDLDRSTVTSGENGGRTLAHVAVARSLVRLGRARTMGSAQEINIPLSRGSASNGSQHVVLFAQLPSYGSVLAVDSRPIVRP